jgi:hypothetical protein
MVAAGSQQGVVTVFQVPKVAIGETVLPTQNKQVQYLLLDASNYSIIRSNCKY